MKHHPEQREGEIYMGNSTSDDILKSSWRTIRRGTVALGIDGNPVNDPDADFKPWFIKVFEVMQTIACEHVDNNPWSADRIGTLQRLVNDRTVFTAVSE